ncbi:MAG: response regulator [Nitrospirae bacterium]|nr:response regulator [Nitrospirota bacterium]
MMTHTLYSKAQSAESVLKDKRFLIIDDYKDFRDSLKRNITANGAKLVDTTEDANDAIIRISRFPYDVILCDYNLGPDKKDGQQIFEELSYKKILGYSTMFFMITAENTIKKVMSVMDYQPDGYLVKPFTTVDIMRRIKDADEKKQLFSQIDKAIIRKDFIAAIALCDNLLKNNPKHILDILKVKGELYLSC